MARVWKMCIVALALLLLSAVTAGAGDFTGDFLNKCVDNVSTHSNT